MKTNDDSDQREADAIEAAILAEVKAAELGPRVPRSDDSFLGSFQTQRNDSPETPAIGAPVTATVESKKP